MATHCYSPYSFRVFSVDSRIRRFCYYIIGTSWFGFISFAAVLSAFLCMALDYSPPEWQVHGTASIVEMSTMVWLLVEICAKCIATGAIQGPGKKSSNFFCLSSVCGFDQYPSIVIVNIIIIIIIINNNNNNKNKIGST